MAALTTNVGKAMFADRLRGTPATYTNPPKYVAIGTGSTAESASQTALVTEVETRNAGTESTVTTTNTGDTYQSVGTVTATATRTVAEMGLFDASTTGNMAMRSLISPTVGLNNGDSIQITAKIQFT
jgi:hypothetical protein